MTAAMMRIAAEGAVDRFCGRPRDRNPYNPHSAPELFGAWRDGWDEADALLEFRAAQEAARWLREAA